MAGVTPSAFPMSSIRMSHVFFLSVQCRFSKLLYLKQFIPTTAYQGLYRPEPLPRTFIYTSSNNVCRPNQPIAHAAQQCCVFSPSGFPTRSKETLHQHALLNPHQPHRRQRASSVSTLSTHTQCPSLDHTGVVMCTLLLISRLKADLSLFPLRQSLCWRWCCWRDWNGAVRSWERYTGSAAQRP